MRGTHKDGFELARCKVNALVQHSKEIATEEFQVGFLYVGKTRDRAFRKEDATHGAHLVCCKRDSRRLCGILKASN